jgi:hypothetical protein
VTTTERDQLAEAELGERGEQEEPVAGLDRPGDGEDLVQRGGWPFLGLVLTGTLDAARVAPD